VLTGQGIGMRGRAGSVGVDGGRRRENEHGDEVGAGALWARLDSKAILRKGYRVREGSGSPAAEKSGGGGAYRRRGALLRSELGGAMR
jgi:hypothetical protein